MAGIDPTAPYYNEWLAGLVPTPYTAPGAAPIAAAPVPGAVPAPAAPVVSAPAASAPNTTIAPPIEPFPNMSSQPVEFIPAKDWAGWEWDIQHPGWLHKIGGGTWDEDNPDDWSFGSYDRYGIDTGMKPTGETPWEPGGWIAPNAAAPGQTVSVTPGQIPAAPGTTGTRGNPAANLTARQGEPGSIKDGFVFMGGDAGNDANWRPMTDAERLMQLLGPPGVMNDYQAATEARLLATLYGHALDPNQILAGTPTLAGQQQQFMQSLQAGQLTGTYNGAKTLEAQRTQADIAATKERLRIAEAQGNSDLALRERLRLDQLTMENNRLQQQESQFGRNLGQRESEFGRNFGLQQGELTGTYNGAPTLANQLYLSNLQANPRNLVESILYGGTGPRGTFGAPMTTQQAGTFLSGTPLVQSLINQSGMVSGQAQGGSNPNFSFISGHQLPVRQTLNDFATNSQRIPALASLFSFSGQDPVQAFGEFRAALPRGNVGNPARFML